MLDLIDWVAACHFSNPVTRSRSYMQQDQLVSIHGLRDEIGALRKGSSKVTRMGANSRSRLQAWRVELELEGIFVQPATTALQPLHPQYTALGSPADVHSSQKQLSSLSLGRVVRPSSSSYFSPRILPPGCGISLEPCQE